MASSSSKFHLLLVVVTLMLFQHSFYATAGPPESDRCNSDDETELDYSLAGKDVKTRVTRQRCLYIGDCSKSKERKSLCAPLGIPAVKCVLNPAGGKHCCCALPKLK